MKKLIISLLTLILLGCASGPEKEQVVVDESIMGSTIFFGTDRSIRDVDTPSKYYGLRRGSMNYGLADLSVAMPANKATLEKVSPLPRDAFIQQLRTAVAASEDASVLIFTHGYNRSFHQVSKQVAEFAVSTGYRGVSVIYSWPSSRNPAGYLEDEVNMRWSYPHMAQFLRDVIEQSGAETTHLVGHSMGARGLTEVMLFKLIPEGLDLSSIGEYVLLAPDIDQAIFERDLAPLMVAAKLDVTLYTSANDKALASAYTLRRYPRVGDSSYGPVLVNGIETIDVTSANKSILGHSYFDESDDVGQDLGELLNNRGTAAERRGLVRVEEPGGSYWQLLVEED